MRIGVPSGIGDVSWIVSKIINAPEWSEMEVVVADGWPFRAQPYLDAVGVRSSYGQFRYEDIVAFEQLHPYREWREVVEKGAGMFLMQPNFHLERGLPLSDYLPDLPTNYHYPLILPSLEGKPYLSNLKEGRWVGISAASYRGARAWKTWESEEWEELCLLLMREGYSICLLGGSWDDLTRSLAGSLPPERTLNLVGRTTFPEACSIHKLLNFYIGFSSGLGIIRSVMSLPTMMLWPSHQQPLSMSWADPLDLESQLYLPSPYTTPKDVFALFKSQEREFGGRNG